MQKFCNRILKIFVYTFCIYIGFCGVARACDADQIDVNGDGTNCVDTKFSVTTTNLVLPDDSEFKFNLSAVGTFYVDCGTDGTLASDANDISGKTIVRNDTNMVLYTCSYLSGGTKIIRFAGAATGYDDRPNVYNNTTIEFYTDATPKLLLSIDGCLTDIFPQTSTSTAGTPGFKQTFYKCTNLNNIPAGLFANIRVTRQRMFALTFFECAALTTIPYNFFVNVTGNTYWAFDRMFASCASLTDIPSDLFSNIPGAPYSFYQTFVRCTSLTSLPDGLFANVKTGEDTMFQMTFWNCTNLTGYIPPSMFAGLIASGAPTANSMWNDTFRGTKLNTTCPAGTTQFTTGYESEWDGKVSCVPEQLSCDAGEYLPAHWYQCEACPTDNYCVGGTYNYSETNASGATQCASGLYAPTGMWESAQCGRILHIGDEVVYLRSVKKTTPSLHIDIDSDGVADYFGNMTTLDVPMTRGTGRKLKISFGGQTYSVYDDSVELPAE